ncbi:UDP-N-acetylmuramoyl-L-alanine--D-glutamate ligase [Corynebacterium sp. CCM 8835]|uniref:UDP-N-acetylmuramoylalanine--D-glutamate ligase n=1 Tax=Corynebacterium antarcticum TaxID=2800405 RepID=A0A9Q4CB11_9CORY|nr:UDP-N-acetylmuramoyl-L-alanine--D-glutamate ligase [Corynebacterium antarcticum]MCK7641799.1 UDP-N-acetylmuramoyl-L-alanine--D-glutamate ligase [Corynebacterium antarcticum]MCK7660105.1 UDP-N-acetylmuramoyl-L-alanine--D-glutamate ligase [Corynebacterium antarcticum]MCL0245028.1 UDP-N-acetylmuramoyl-L-alanine--D-glutamate ligase [Corynebacterium antarcticum]MCX7491402.1 UDP-N-acetylmuramoyl-L-alanine--D-glutamate ligase [Corynebacterium antarcticum]MCX7537421.1 UDP-N-acetylmuramoyl-L-alanine
MIRLDAPVLVTGAGVSGAGCARMLCDLGAGVTVADDDETARLRVAEATGCRTTDVATALDRIADYRMVVTSPGWRPDTPILRRAVDTGVEVIGDVELAWRLDRAGYFGEPRTWIVITGTNGKTTTTAMCAAMMSRGPETAAAVGNIGVAVGDALTAEPRIDVLVAELSSFQLHWAPTLTPDAGALLNLAEDHIDWHGSFDAYAGAKLRALRGRYAVIGVDDAEVVARTSGQVDAATETVGFTLGTPARGQLGVVDGHLVDNAFGDDLVLAPADGISPAGPAGILDALAAAALARSQGVGPSAIREALATYEVSGHRGQVVHSHAGIDYIDNSKATNPHAADAALTGHDSVIWIAGGQLKGADVDDLVARHAPRLKAALLLGADRDVLARAVRDHAPHAVIHSTDSTDPEEAMTRLVTLAVDIAEEGDVVLLAPAAASLDMYRGMGHRGDCFARVARELTE